jgi:hypothetical protein
VERSHRTDDEEFYRPFLLHLTTVAEFTTYAQRWTYFYNALRSHSGDGMANRPPLVALQDLGYTGPKAIAAFPPLLLDRISTDLLLACDSEAGIDLLAHYSRRHRRS